MSVVNFEFYRVINQIEFDVIYWLSTYRRFFENIV
jgi:hypothetical protein